MVPCERIAFRHARLAFSLAATTLIITQIARRSAIAPIVRASYAVPRQTSKRNTAKIAPVARVMAMARPGAQPVLYQSPRPAMI
jgi:hypothetical protein